MSRTTRDFSVFGFSNGPRKWKNTADKKPWFKPNKQFKTMQAQRRRAQDNMVMKNDLLKKDLDNLTFPNHHKEDVWLWN